MPGRVRRLSMKHHHSSGKYRLLKRVIMMCLSLILVCSMSISAFAVNRIGRAENETTQSVQMTDNQKGEAAATRQKSSEAQTKTRQENMKKSDSESKTKDNSEEQKKDSKDADNKGAKENSTEKDAKEDSEKNISEEEKSTKEEKNTEKKSEETTDVSEATTTAAKETTTEAAEKKTEAVTEKTPEGKDSKEATSEEKAEEETQAEDDKNKEIAVTSISGPTEVQVGKTIRLTGTSGSYGYSHSWSSSNKNIATVTGNGSTAEVKGVAVGTVTITHRYSSQWNGNTRTETYQVKVTKFADNYSGEAAIYYLANPAGDPWTNDTGAWAPSQDTSNTLANISTSGATWEDGHVDDIVYENKNIKSNVASYITSWPDGSKGSTWTVKEGDSSTASYFTFILNSIWDKYKSSVAADLGIGADQLQQSDIKEITLTPRKISRDNGGTHPYHIDCALSIKSTKVFTAKFWVKEPGESSEYRQIDAKNYLTGNPVARTTKATIGSTKTVNGVTYVLDGWYPENAEGGAYGSTKIADNRWNYTPSDAELADGTVNFYAHYSPTTTSIKLKKLVTGSMGDKQKKFHFTISIKKEDENVTFKVDNTSKTGSATVDLANDEESTLTEIPVGADVSITEEDYSGSRYTTSYVIDNGNSAPERVANISNIQAKNDVSAHEIVFTNNKEAIPDTGITLDSLPFIALLALSIAGGIFFLFCRYKKRFV